MAAVLATQLGRGGRETRLSLGRALVALGEVVMPALRAAAADDDRGCVNTHALPSAGAARPTDPVPVPALGPR